MTNDFRFEIIDDASGLDAALFVAMKGSTKIKGFRVEGNVLRLYSWVNDPNITEFPAPMDREMTRVMILAWLNENQADHGPQDSDVWYATGFKMTGAEWSSLQLTVEPYSVEYHK